MYTVKTNKAVLHFLMNKEHFAYADMRACMRACLHTLQCVFVFMHMVCVCVSMWSACVCPRVFVCA